MTETTPALPERKRPIPKRVREAIAAIVEGRVKTITAAAKKVGLSREYLSRALGEPHVAAHLRDRAARVVAISSGHAAARVTELITRSRSEHVAFEASKFSLGVAGIRPQPEAQLNVNIDIKAGYVIDLAPRSPSDERPMKIVSPQPAALPGAPTTG
jgi:ParB-like chromosome segregation protein Spo0J